MKRSFDMEERGEIHRTLAALTAPGGRCHGFFEPRHPLAVARAPGRLDAMGGIADYSGSLVLQLPLREAAVVVAQLHGEPVVRALSLTHDDAALDREATFPADEILGSDRSGLSYEAVHAYFQAQGSDRWAAYVVGVLAAAVRERWMHGPAGASILVMSSVPEGCGVSSSAAIEVAALYALCAAAIANAAGAPLPNLEAAHLCQRVENLIVGAPCGIMDQITSAFGQQGQLLELLCQPATILGQAPIPEDLEFFGIDSGIHYAVSGAEYAQVRVGAFMGYRILLDSAGIKVHPGRATGQLFAEDDRWQGYLANVLPSELDGEFAAVLPDFMSGSEFLACFGGTTDAVTRVCGDIVYPVRAATAHAVHEHQRVRLFSELLRASRSERRNTLLGELMYQSHASYSACGLGSTATDSLVRLVRQSSHDAGLYGAKITGGGSGGTVAILARTGALDAVNAIANQYSAESGRPTRVFRGSSPGAEAFGTFSLPGVESC